MINDIREIQRDLEKLRDSLKEQTRKVERIQERMKNLEREEKKEGQSSY